MRKIVAITLLIVFFSAQYGKVASYLYCKLRLDPKTATCDCEKKLSPDKKDHSDHSPLHIKQFVEEPFLKTNSTLFSLVELSPHYAFNSMISSLANGFELPPLRPPAMA